MSIRREARRSAIRAKRGEGASAEVFGGLIATGNSLVAENDEEEHGPGFTEAELLEGDVYNNVDKALRREREDVRRDVERAINERRGRL